MCFMTREKVSLEKGYFEPLSTLKLVTPLKSTVNSKIGTDIAMIEPLLSNVGKFL